MKRDLHSEKHNFYPSPCVTRVTQIEEIEMDKACSTYSVDHNLVQDYDQEV
jgi:hypothetical protein